MPSRMLFIVSEMTQGRAPLTIVFPMNPSQVQVTHTTRTNTFTILELGTIIFPRGDDPYQVSWSGLLPGPTRYGHKFLQTEWQDPYAIITQLHLWQALGAKLSIQVTDAPINMTGFITNLTHTIGAVPGDINYDIAFTQLREVIVGADPSTNAQANAISTLAGGTSTILASEEEDVDGGDGTGIDYPADVPVYEPPQVQGQGDTRNEANRPGSYLVQPGDNLITIALRFYGEDQVWRRIWDANRDLIGENYNLIQVGWTLRLP